MEGRASIGRATASPAEDVVASRGDRLVVGEEHANRALRIRTVPASQRCTTAAEPVGLIHPSGRPPRHRGLHRLVQRHPAAQQSNHCVRCLLFRASGSGGRGWTCEVQVDLAGDVAFQAAEDVELGQALVGPALDIGPGGLVAVHADQGDAPQGVVGSAVTSPVEPVAVGAARGRRDGGGAAEMGEGSLRAQPLGVVARGDQQLAGGLDPDASQRQRCRGGRVTSACSWRSNWSSSA